MNDEMLEPATTATVLPRLARAAVARLAHAGVDVEIRPVGDGRVAIVLALPWAELLVERLELEARTLREQLRHVTRAEATRQAELAAASVEGRQRIQTGARAIYAEYRRLRAEGLPHAEAIKRLRDTDGDHRRNLNISDLTALIHEMGAIHRRERMDARRRQVLGLHRQGRTRREIARELSLTKEQVAWIFRNAPKGGGQHEGDDPAEA